MKGRSRSGRSAEPSETAQAPTEESMAALVTHSPALLRQPAIRIRLGPADHALVALGAAVAAGEGLVEQARDVAVAEARLPPGAQVPEPGRTFERRESLAGEGRRALRFDAPGRVLYTTPAGTVRVALGRGRPAVLPSPVAGTVVALDDGCLALQAEGLGLAGLVAAGRPSSGVLTLAVASPDDELATSSLDVRCAGQVLVAGARADVEALGRARAMGARGVISGGAVSRDMRTFDASERRQRATAESGAPFATLVLDGYGKRPIPAAAWAILRAAEGREVAIVPDPPLLILPADVLPADVLPADVLPADAFAGDEAAVDDTTAPRGRGRRGRQASRPPGAEAAEQPPRVRVVAGPWLGQAGALIGPAGRRSVGAGLEAACAWVRLDPPGRSRPGPEAAAEVGRAMVALPLADLERAPATR